MEEDPLIPQRMRDIARTQMCDELASTYNLCGKAEVRNSILLYRFVKFAVNKRFWHYKFSFYEK